MSEIDKKSGVQPTLREYLGRLEEALSGDMVFSISPATVTPAPTAAAWTRSVVIELQNAAGDVHTWFSADIGTTIADTGGGTATITDTTPPMVNGRCVVIVSGDAATWANTETDTLTLANSTILGYTVTGGTSVETFTTP